MSIYYFRAGGGGEVGPLIACGGGGLGRSGVFCGGSLAVCGATADDDDNRWDDVRYNPRLVLSGEMGS